MNVYKVGSDLGDALAACCIVRGLGRGHIRLYSTPGTKGFSDDRYNALKALLEIQPWAESVARFDESEGLGITHDFTGFRARFHDGSTLIEKQARWIGLPHNSVDTSPWLTIPEVSKHGKIVLCRSTRYTGFLNWFHFWQKPAHDLMYCGLSDEFEAFNYNCGPRGPNARYKPRIPFHSTVNLLELAKIIKGARLLVCNAGCPLWIALGLGTTPILMEAVNDDSIIGRSNVRVVMRPEDNPDAREFEKL